MHGLHPNPYVRLRPELPWPPPGDDQKSRSIPIKQLWALSDIHKIAKAQLAKSDSSLIVPITDKCGKDIQDLEFTTVDLAERLLRVTDGHYDKSMWCQKSKWPGVTVREEALWFPCDAYKLVVVERLSTGWEGKVEYYLKFCLSPANTVVLLVSVHV